MAGRLCEGKEQSAFTDTTWSGVFKDNAIDGNVGWHVG